MLACSCVKSRGLNLLLKREAAARVRTQPILMFQQARQNFRMPSNIMPMVSPLLGLLSAMLFIPFNINRYITG
ncbi:hypothetical protein SAMN02744775_00004 [Enterobacter sp. CC120223-11]|nr:hypothetical protein SAMN02744775_00004 [Enterobacter sp. CC120223-11]